VPDVTELRVVGDDTIELDGISIARLLPNLSLSIRDRLTEIFDAIDADADYIAELKDRVASSWKAAWPPPRREVVVKGVARTCGSGPGRPSGTLEGGGASRGRNGRPWAS
jgi:hypothetical protein